MSHRIIVLEGPDGTGKTRHVTDLTDALKRADARTVWFHHQPPVDGADPDGRVDSLAAAELDQAHGRLRTVHRSRPCAACGETGPRFVCLGCSMGSPSKGTWRITPWAAARIRAKAHAARFDPVAPLP